MCVVHKPQIPQSATEPDKPLPILRNQMLDGMLGNIAALRTGRDSLRIPLNPLGIPVGGATGFPGSGQSGGGSSSSSGGGGTTTTTVSGGTVSSGSGSFSGGGRTRTAIS